MDKYHSICMEQCTNNAINVLTYTDAPFYIKICIIFAYKVGTKFAKPSQSHTEALGALQRPHEDSTEVL